MSATEETSDVVAGLAVKARRILNVLDAHGGRANTAEIRTATDLSGQLIRYHTDNLAECGLLEIVGREFTGSGSPAKVYSLTESGENAVTQLSIGEGATPGEKRAELRRRLDRLEAQVESLSGELMNTEDTIEGMAQSLSALGEIVDDMRSDD